MIDDMVPMGHTMTMGGGCMDLDDKLLSQMNIDHAGAESGDEITLKVNARIIEITDSEMMGKHVKLSITHASVIPDEPEPEAKSKKKSRYVEDTDNDGE